ncbi:Fe-S cluster assembly protein SufB [Calditrichota bacterium]
MSEAVLDIKLDEYKYGFSDPENYLFRTEKGLSPAIVEAISGRKNEDDWMKAFRMNALSWFNKKPMPSWGPDLSGIDFDDLTYYIQPQEKGERSWDDVPSDIRNTFEKLGIPEAERKYLAGVGAQYESEVVYHNLKKEWEDQGVLFLDCDTGYREHPEIFHKYFGSVIPPGDNKFAALNSAVWSGGSFVYIPKGVKLDIPLQTYFRINAEKMGQFERTLIIAEEGSFVHYVEGCTAPTYSASSLHSAVVEIIAMPGSRVRYTTIQNWANNVYNLVTKRAMAYEDATVEWVDCNLGSKVTMKFPSVYLMGEGAHAEILSVAYAGKGQHTEAGAKCIHVAPNTTSQITSKSISQFDGRSTYRGLLEVHPGATGVKSNVECDALLLDKEARSDTYPYNDIHEDDVEVGHEASVSKISDEQLFYLMSRGIKQEEALAMIVRGFIDPVAKELPMEYAVELNRLIELQMEGSVG